MKIKKVSSNKIRPLRHLVLRQGKPFSTTEYIKDKEKDTFHLACLVENKIVTCATFYPEKTDQIKSNKPYRLRGMATLETHRRKGFGNEIIKEAIKEIKKSKGDLLWCNARIVALGFYKKIGFKTVGDTFNIGDIGLHYVMYKKL